MLALLAPFGIADASSPGFNLYGTPAAERMAHLFAKGVPDAFATRFARPRPGRSAGCRPTSATLPRPTSCGRSATGHREATPPDRAPRLTLWGDLDEVNPVTNAASWGGAQVIAGAGHLLEWDAPEQVSAALLDFLNSLGG